MSAMKAGLIVGKVNKLIEARMVFPSPFNTGLKRSSELHLEPAKGLKEVVAFCNVVVQGKRWKPHFKKK